MKKHFSKSFAAVIISAVMVQVPLLAQVKINFTPEVRRSDEKPTGLADFDYSSERNKEDVSVPKKTRGVERYNKLNIWGEVIPDSFLFHRNTLSQKQKAVYDAGYKGLMKNEDRVEMPVGLTRTEMRETIHALYYDNPEAFWWDGGYSVWTNSDDTVTAFRFSPWMDMSELDASYEKFWNATAPILFYASKLPDDMSKIKYIHDYLCLSIEYDYDSLNAGKISGKLQTAYSSAVEYKTVCAGYSALFQYYMQNLGIPCAKISSNSHAWNLLKVNGQCYQMDVTWNDANAIPPYFNLTHEEMAKIESHTPDESTKKIIDANPNTNRQMSYIQYFGALLEGSPYTYKELADFDYTTNSNNSNTVKIYQTEPTILSTVHNADELKTALFKTCGSDYYDGTIFQFYVPTRDEMDKIYSRIYEGEICDYHKGVRSYVGNGVIYSLTLASSKKQPEGVKTDNSQKLVVYEAKNFTSLTSLFVTLGGGEASAAKKIAESFEDVASASVNNLGDGLFELKLSVNEEAEIRPALAKKLVNSGFDLFEIHDKNNEPPKIGDKGPCGGTVFYIEGKKAYECSEILGTEDWETAKKLCKNYKGGGKADWALPDKDQLENIYQNLRKSGIVNDNTWNWGASTNTAGSAWVQNFSDGEKFYTTDKNYKLTVRAVRAYKY